MLSWADAPRARLAEIDVSDEAIAALTEQAEAAARRTAELAEHLSDERLAAAAKLATAVTAELGGPGHAQRQPRASRSARARWLRAVAEPRRCTARPAASVRTGPTRSSSCCARTRDAPALPIGRGASGGELSRVMLALEVCLAGTDPVPTMVFDEVDAGVGGRAAVEVGRRLARLARDHQVLVVTHLAQVAAFADRHIVVDQAGRAGRATGVTASDVRIVARGRRIDRRRAGPDARRRPTRRPPASTPPRLLAREPPRTAEPPDVARDGAKRKL